MRTFMAHGEIVVIETEDDIWLGTAEIVGDLVVLRSGFVGRPVLIALDDIVRVTPASEHEDLEDLVPAEG